MTTLPITLLRRDGGTQPRVALSDETVQEYADAIATGAKLPPVTVFHEGAAYWLADGFHRVDAHRRLGLKEIDCDVREGTRDDAVWHACSANSTHGLRRSNADKRRAVETALAHPQGASLSDRAIAEHCGVSHNFVGELRRLSSDDSAPARRTGRDGRTTATGSEKKSAAARGRRRGLASAPPPQPLGAVEEAHPGEPPAAAESAPPDPAAMVDAGPVEAERSSMMSVSPEQVVERLRERGAQLKRNLVYHCHEIMRFLKEAEDTATVLGYHDVEDLLRTGFEFDPVVASWSLDGLKLLRRGAPEEAAQRDGAAAPADADAVLGQRGLRTDDGKQLCARCATKHVLGEAHRCAPDRVSLVRRLALVIFGRDGDVAVEPEEIARFGDRRLAQVQLLLDEF